MLRETRQEAILICLIVCTASSVHADDNADMTVRGN
jgi:hypothetical protein